MLTMLLAEGLTSGLEQRIAAFVIKCLAVAGGFIAGYCLGWLLAWGINRWIMNNKVPEPLKKAVSIISGIAVALLVALFIFGEGGGGLFGHGKGSGEGQKGADQGEKGQQPPNQPDNQKDTVPPNKKPDLVTPLKPTDTTITVTVLGGSDVTEPGQYYLIEGETTAKDIAGLEQVIIDRKTKATKGSTVGIIVTFRATNRPPLDPEAESITDLRQMAQRQTISLIFPPQ